MDLSRLSFLIALCAVALLSPLSAEAHKLNIFAWPVGKVIYGEAVFRGGRKAINVKITVQDVESHKLLFETQSDNQGTFKFTPPEQATREQLDLLVVADSGDGHRGEWLLTAKEYLVRSTDAEQLPGSVDARVDFGGIDERMVRHIVAEELNRELAPMKQALAEGSEKEIDLLDIAGGVGCIIGLAGILAWIQARKRKHSS